MCGPVCQRAKQSIGPIYGQVIQVSGTVAPSAFILPPPPSLSNRCRRRTTRGETDDSPADLLTPATATRVGRRGFVSPPSQLAFALGFSSFSFSNVSVNSNSRGGRLRESDFSRRGLSLRRPRRVSVDAGLFLRHPFSHLTLDFVGFVLKCFSKQQRQRRAAAGIGFSRRGLSLR